MHDELDKRDDMESVVEESSMTVKCRMCNTLHVINVSQEQIKVWKAGALIQVAFPNLNADERELLMTATCGTCFDSMFPDDDLDDPEYLKTYNKEQ